MALITTASDWDQLLQQSESLAAKDNQGFPRVERDITQVEDFTAKLKAKAQRIDSSGDALAATRLLAQEGVNPRLLSRALQSVELKPTYEDVFRVETSSVEEYLQQVHEMTMVTAIQEAQQDTIAAFQAFMDECMEADWANDKRQLFDAALPERAYSHSSSANLSGPSSSMALAPLRSVQSFPGDATHGGPELHLSGREKGYTEVVRALNEATLSRQDFPAIQEFAAVAAKDAQGEPTQSTISMVWSVLERMLSEVRAEQSSRARTVALIRGARSFLESGHAKHVQATIQANRSQANLGGAPSRKAEIYAFLRLRQKDAAALDFDSPSGLDTTWQRIFFCLRSGYYQEAVEEAQRARDGSMVRGGGFAKYLQDWVRNDGHLSQESASVLAEECDRLRAAADRAAWQRPGFCYKVALHTLLAGDRRAVDALLREAGSVFATIEDFMWFMVAMAGLPAAAGGAGPSSLRTSAGALGDKYTLSDLQQYLTQFPASHYSQGGKQPLLYVTVLLLSLQFRAALTFLAKDASTRSFRIDAPHLAIALLHYQILDAGGQGDAGLQQGVDPGQLIHHYARGFAAAAPETALEYYMLAAKAQGDDRQTRARLLRELLVESGAFGFLLGSGGSRGGALDRWLGSDQERQELLAAVAYECQVAAQLDWAAELYLYAGAARPALHLLNLQISNLLEPVLQEPAKREELESLMRRGGDAAAKLAGSSAAEDEVEKAAFRQLKVAQHLLFAQQRGDNTQATQLLAELNFLPTEDFRLQRCTESVASLHPAIAPRLPILLLAAANALADIGQKAQLRTLVAFAGNLPQRISQGTFQQLNEIYNAM